MISYVVYVRSHWQACFFCQQLQEKQGISTDVPTYLTPFKNNRITLNACVRRQEILLISERSTQVGKKKITAISSLSTHMK